MTVHTTQPTGTVVAVRGAVVDVDFTTGHLPQIDEALVIEWDRSELLMVEVQAHLNESTVRKIQMLTDADVTFVLSDGGHNAGIVNPPGRPHSNHQIATHRGQEKYVDPDAWQKAAIHHYRSWGPCWRDWLVGQSSEQISSPPMGAPESGYAPIAKAPGTYVLEP
jgi:hypothetical protein